MGEVNETAPVILEDLWDDATNAVCQTLQEHDMCRCQDGMCVAATVSISEKDMVHALGRLRAIAKAEPSHDA